MVEILVTLLLTLSFAILQDPYKAFGLPSVGRLSKYIQPSDIPGVNIALDHI